MLPALSSSCVNKFFKLFRNPSVRVRTDMSQLNPVSSKKIWLNFDARQLNSVRQISAWSVRSGMAYRSAHPCRFAVCLIFPDSTTITRHATVLLDLSHLHPPVLNFALNYLHSSRIISRQCLYSRRTPFADPRP